SLPNIIEFKVVQTEHGVKGDSAKGSSKLAEIETGVKINVPLFIGVGDTIKVDTRTGEYVERAY
ncbi:MAG: elongation factor P, partial [Candidatus Omnitrophica bacterium]|nr:elongation factor P [Candidatus Omnitrophota bacterium]